MVLTSKTIKFVVLTIVGLALLFVGIIVFFILYESRTDISTDEPFVQFIDEPIEVKVVSTLRWNKNSLRFKNYSIAVNEDSNYDLEDVKSVKRYQPGDTIYFYAAKKYKSMHVGETYYLIGRDTLENGNAIEFEYYFEDRYLNNIWETEEEFLDRIKKD